MTQTSYSYRLFARSDFSAFWALFTDNLVNLMVSVGDLPVRVPDAA